MIDRMSRALMRPAFNFSRNPTQSQCTNWRHPIRKHVLQVGIVQLCQLQLQRRLYSTPTTPPPAAESSLESSGSAPSAPAKDLRSQFASSQPPPKAPKRNFRTVVYAALFLMLGMTAGQYVRWIIAPPDLPLPGTREDAALTASLHKMASKLPLVQSLNDDPAWRSWDAYTSIPEDERAHRLTTGPLGGARGLGGYQRIFEDTESGEFVSVVWVGGALAGWPGVAHGGLVAMLMDESLGRCAFARLPAGTAVTANLEIKYMAPTVTNSFVVVRCTPIMDGATDRKQWISGRLERTDGRVCVEAKALYVVPRHQSGKPKMESLGEEF